MPRTADAEVITHLNNDTTYKLAFCYRIVRKDGVQVGFTSFDRDLNIDLGDGLGSLTYKADTVIDNSEIQNKASIGASNTEISQVLFEDNSLEIEDVILGLYDDATLDIFEVKWDTQPYKVIRGFCGYLSEARIVDKYAQFNYRSLAGLYDQNILRQMKRGCSYELGLNGVGYHKCYVELTAPTWQASTAHTARQLYDAKTEPGALVKPTVNNDYWYTTYTGGTTGTVEPTWPTTPGATVVDGDITWTAMLARTYDGTVTTVIDNRQFVDTSCLLPDNWWQFGWLLWTSGNNAGKRVEITSNIVAETKVILFERMMQNIQVGDTYTLTVGCAKSKDICIVKFDNVFWFGGFNDIPGVLDLIQTPEAK